MTNTLYFGDNLSVLRDQVKDESVDLVYLDPPFNSNATYNVLFEERSGEAAEARACSPLRLQPVQERSRAATLAVRAWRITSGR